jgi:hypothetical protein
MLKISTIAMVCGLTIVMSGCASDVDKCVDAQIDAWKKGVSWMKSYKSLEEVRVAAHLECLEAQGKN